MAHKENYNPNQYPPVIEKRTAVGCIRTEQRKFPYTIFKKNVAMIAVLCNGITIASFLYEDEADRYIEKRFPNRERHAFDNWTKEN